MHIQRRFTKAGQSAYAEIEFRKALSEIKNPDGSVVFRLDDIEVPAQFCQVAADILAQKYFRKAGVPARLKKVEENDVPSFLWRSVPDEAALAKLPEAERYGSETDARQVFDRLAGTWTYWGWKGGYFDSEEDAQRLLATSSAYMLATQSVAPNSPQWFNTGLHWAYGIDGPGQGHFYVDPFTGKLTKSKSAYEHPQPHACFIQSVSATTSSTRAASWTSGCARRACSNTAPAPARTSRMLRGEGEKLSGGGRSSGLMCFLKIGDRAAGAIKSGGTTRRAAKMVVVDVDHPDIEDYIDWKVKEEQKVAALVTGSKIVKQHLAADHEGLRQLRRPGRRLLRPAEEPGAEARDQGRQEERACRRTTSSASSSSPARATPTIDFQIYDTDWDSEAYLTVSGQNSNNSVSRQRRFPARGRDRRRLEPHRPQGRQGDEDAEGPRPLGEDRLRRLGLGRSRPPVQHHDQRLAHLRRPAARSALQPVLGIHVPRRHGLQSRLAQPPALPQRRRHDRHRRLRARRPPVDHRARDLGADGAVPVEGDRASSPTSTARSASATPISAAC